MFKNIIGDKHFCGLDIGAQSIKVGLVKAGESHKPQLEGVYEVETCGFKKTSISDLSEFSECIHAAVSGLAKKAGVKIKDINLGVNGDMIEQHLTAAVIPLLDRGTKIITPRDVKNVQAQAKLLGVNMEETILHEFPQYYNVDDVNIALNPVGLYGRKLEVHSLILTVHGSTLKNIIKAVNQAGYDVGRISLTSIAAAESCLNPFQKKQGCALIDIGSSVTNMILFKDQQLKHLVHIAWGGEEISRSIAESLKIPLGLAEEIKKSYASAAESEKGRDEDLLIKKEDGYVPVKRNAIIDAIEPSIRTFVSAIQEALQSSGLGGQLNSGVVMAGGGALLPGLPEYLEEQSRLPVKIGAIKIATRRLHNASKFAAAVGLAQEEWLQPSAGSAADPSKGQGSVAARFLNRVREIYLEYF